MQHRDLLNMPTHRCVYGCRIIPSNGSLPLPRFMLLVGYIAVVEVPVTRGTSKYWQSAPSPGWGPRGQGPGKNNWTDHVPSGLPDKNFSILGHFWYLKSRRRPNGKPIFHGGWSRRLSHTLSYPACHAPEMHCMST